MNQSQYGDLVSCFSVPERRVDSLYATGAAAFCSEAALLGPRLLPLHLGSGWCKFRPNLTVGINSPL